VPPAPGQYASFTAKTNGGLARVLTSPCQVSAAFDPVNTPVEDRPKLEPFTAIWDTGATGSVVTEDVVARCGLKPTGMMKVHGVHGEEFAETFIVAIRLPNGVGFRDIKVTKGKLPAGSHVLIGMDIITTGDFAVTNVNNRTVFTFRHPSLVCLDFVEDTHPGKAKKLGRLMASGGLSGGSRKGNRHKGRR